MKLELDYLERRARSANDALSAAGPDGSQMVDVVTAGFMTSSPLVTLALVSRIRELEAAYRQLMHDHVRDADEGPMHDLLERGAVIA